MYMKITKLKTVNEFEEEDEVNYREQPSGPVYSHNPYHSTKFPLLVLDVRRDTVNLITKVSVSFTGMTKCSLYISKKELCI